VPSGRKRKRTIVYTNYVVRIVPLLFLIFEFSKKILYLICITQKFPKVIITKKNQILLKPLVITSIYNHKKQTHLPIKIVQTIKVIMPNE
jgi:hypothetical protein